MLRRLIQRPIAVVMVLTAVMVVGVAAMKLLPVSLAPDVDVPQITVQVSSPEMSARELNEAVVAPLRAQLTQVSHLETIRTEAKNGGGTLSLGFDYRGDMDYLFIEVNEKIDRAMGTLPQGLERPKVVKARASDIPAFYVDVTLKDAADDGTPEGEVSPRFTEMSSFTRQVVARRIEQLSEVAMVDVSGLVYPEILITPDAARMASLGITPARLEAALRGANIRLGNLSIRDGEYRYNVRFEEQMARREDIENVWLKDEGRIYQIKELASVTERPRQRSGLVTSNGRDAVTLAVVKRSEARMANLKGAMEGLLGSFARDYPEIEFTVTRDQTELLDYSINNLIQNIWIGILLACAVIFMFMQSMRTSALIVITIPTALVISLLGFYVLGISINIISLAGLIMGVGMMVDNSIVVIDNITYHWQGGRKLSDAVVVGAGEVFAPMLSSVMTTCAVFVPLVFLSGIAGALFFDQAMAVTLTLFSSLAVSVLVIPVFYYLFYRRQEAFTRNAFLERMTPKGMAGVYERALKWFFRRIWVVWGSFAVAIVGIVAIFALIGKERLPALSHDDSLVRVSWNERVTVEENRRRSEALVAEMGDRVRQATVMAGVQQFLLGHTGETSISEATIYMKAVSASAAVEIERLAAEWLRSHYPEAVHSVRGSGNVFDAIFSSGEAKLAAHLRPTDGRAPDPAGVNEVLARIAAALPGVAVEPAEWEEYVEYVARPEMMALYEVGYSEILATLRNALGDNRIMTITQGTYSVPVVIGEGKTDVRQMIEGNFIRKPNGDVPLGVLLSETRSRDLKSITGGREGEYYHLGLELADRDVPRTMTAIREIVREEGRFEVDFSGSYFTNRAMTGELSVILAIAILLLYFILASQFESLVQPLVILSEIVIDIFGALAVMALCGVTLNLMSLIGLVVMCGIVINDSILKVDTINQIRKSGRGVMYAVMDAGRRRLGPILMTSLTTILGVAPFLVRGDMGSDLQFPLSVALIGGMVVGTLVSIFFIPIAYYVIYRRRG
jgi:multidrug efflux pump subunit AcrB